MNTGYDRIIYTYLAKNSPEYLGLCIKTWLKYLPEGYKIIVLNETNYKNFVSEDIFQNLKKIKNIRFFCDYLAAAVLYSKGGMFLDADTMMTEKFFPQDILLKCTNLVMFSNASSNICSGFMAANKGSQVLKEILNRYSNLKQEDTSNWHRNFWGSDIAKNYTEEEILLLDSEDNAYVMEKAIYGVESGYLYNKYYFSDICQVSEFFEYTKGLTALHNSLTPEKYKKMTAEEFLNQDILLSKILKTILTAQVS